MAAMTDAISLKAGSISGGSRRSSAHRNSNSEVSAFPFPRDRNGESSGHESGSDAGADDQLRIPKPNNSRHSRPKTRHSTSPSRNPSLTSATMAVAGGGMSKGRKTSSLIEDDSCNAGVVEKTLSILLQRHSLDESFGLAISGGTDVADSVLILSEVYPQGLAELAGLCTQDVVFELDGIDASKLTHQDAVQIIQNALQVWLKVRRSTPESDLILDPTRRTSNSNNTPDKRSSKVARRADIDAEGQTSPRHKDKHLQESVNNGQLNNQAYAWIDVNRQPCSPPPDEDELSIFSPNFLPERKTALLVSEDIHLGLLIRGGLEYGLGIYVTGLDKASAAEAANLKVGDQIISVNNYDFCRITHSRAVRVLRTHRHMNMVVRHVGKLPFARRLSPSSTAPQLPAIARISKASSYKSSSPLSFLDSEQEEINDLMREANRDSYLDRPTPFLSSSSEGLLEDTIDLETAVNNWSKNALTIERNQSRNNFKTSERNEHWLSVIESSAEVLLEDTTQKQALMYFIDDYLKGAICVDALVLSFFHWINTVPKFQLIEDIRNIIQAQDIQLYDSLTTGMKMEWMASPAKMFSGIGDSSMDLALMASMSPSRTPLPNYSALVYPLNTSPSGLKSALKSTSSFTLPTDLSVLNFSNHGSIDDSTNFPLTQTTGIMTPSKIMSWSMADLTTPAQNQWPLTTSGSLQNNGTLKFEYDTPVLDMELFTAPIQQLPPAQIPQQMPIQQVVPYQTYVDNALNPYLQPVVNPYSIQEPLLYSTMQNGLSQRLLNAYHPNTNGQMNHTRRSLSNSMDTSHKTGFRSRWPGSVERSANRERYNEEIRVPSPRYSFSDHDSQSGRMKAKPNTSPRERRNTAGSLGTNSEDHSEHLDRRKDSHEDEATSCVEHQAKQRPQSLMMNQKIGPSKSDLKLPVVIETIVVKKNAPYLGIAIEGGTETKQMLPRIINIQPKGCAHLNGNLKVGHVIISVNGKNLDNLSHAQCVNLIKDTFLDKSSKTMEFVVKEVNKLPSTS